jgi:ATPase subunit of ABC transporter with duplicated ATPase domains
MFKPIQLKNVSFILPQKSCFENFSAQVPFGSRIAIIARNGLGKSSLLKMLLGEMKASEGEIIVPQDAIIGSVPQIINDFESFSGGERFNKALTKAINPEGDILLLDEPTNHLDDKNRLSLMRMLRFFKGTLIVASHDVELLENLFDTFWHIEGGEIHVFSGSYHDYLRKVKIHCASLRHKEKELFKKEKDVHNSLMKEQVRAKQSKQKGKKSIKQKKWPTIVSNAKASRALQTSGSKKKAIRNAKNEVQKQLSELELVREIKPSFSLKHFSKKNANLVSITEGSVGFNKPIISNISLSIGSEERVAISGSNGSGKTTFLRALIGDPMVQKTGSWQVENSDEIGYLCQYYKTLQENKTVLETITEILFDQEIPQIRRFLANFLFFKNEEVNTLVKNLSGGEKVRLSLAIICAKNPKILILDELTNNLDRQTREYVIQVLCEYPGALVVVSHDTDFLKRIAITTVYEFINGDFLLHDSNSLLQNQV